jgi:cellulose biosynthesis protein BcsQ
MANCAVDAYIKRQLQSFGNIFIDVQIPLSADIRESVILGRPISFFRRRDNSSVQAYERLVAEIERRILLCGNDWGMGRI